MISASDIYLVNRFGPSVRSGAASQLLCGSSANPSASLLPTNQMAFKHIHFYSLISALCITMCAYTFSQVHVRGRVHRRCHSTFLSCDLKKKTPKKNPQTKWMFNFFPLALSSWFRRFHALFVSCSSKSLPFFLDLNCYEKDPHPYLPLSQPPQSFYGSAEAEGFIVVLCKMPRCHWQDFPGHHVATFDGHR